MYWVGLNLFCEVYSVSDIWSELLWHTLEKLQFSLTSLLLTVVFKYINKNGFANGILKLKCHFIKNKKYK